MPVMSALLLFLASAATSPDASVSRRSEPAAGARATGSVSVRIVRGAHISMSEVQDASLPEIQPSSVRERDGSLRAARLVEFN
jgi:hypothetical protein